MNKSWNQILLIKSCSVFVVLLFSITALGQMKKLKIADNHRFLVKEDNTPFVWIGDTTGSLPSFHQRPSIVFWITEANRVSP